MRIVLVLYVHLPSVFSALPKTTVVVHGRAPEGRLPRRRDLWGARGAFQKTISIARRHDAGEQWRDLKYVVFDAPSVQAPFEARLAAAERAVADAPYAEALAHVPCRDAAHLASELQRVEGVSGEGLMMRKAGSAYVNGRSSDLLKVKTFKDDEALVIGHEAGKGRHLGRLGALLCRSRTGKTFKVGTGLKDAQRNAPPSVGTVITFRYFEMTEAGIPRFPAFMRVRADVDPAVFAV